MEVISYSSKENSTKIVLHFPKHKVRTFVKRTSLKLKSQVETNKILAGDFNTLLSSMTMQSRKKLNREIIELTDIVNQIDLTAIDSYLHK